MGHWHCIHVSFRIRVKITVSLWLNNCSLDTYQKQLKHVYVQCFTVLRETKKKKNTKKTKYFQTVPLQCPLCYGQT